MDQNASGPRLIDNAILKQIVDEVMQESTRKETELNSFTINYEDCSDDKIDDRQKVVLSDAIVRNEMFTDMWARSIYTCLTDITYTTIPHYEVLQKCICFILNSETLHFGIAKGFLTRLLFFHPPTSVAMEHYYWHILNDTYVSLEFGGFETENIFDTIVKYLSSCLENPVLIKDKENCILGMRDYWSPERDTSMALNFTVRLYYKHLPVAKQFDRVLLIFEFLYDILHKNFVHRLKLNRVHTQRDRCLLSRLFWSRMTDVGIITPGIKNLNRLLVLMGVLSENNIGQYHKKFMVLLSDFYRHIDNERNFNPFYKNKKSYLASELSLKLYQGLRNDHLPQGIKFLRMVRPHWLRLAASSKWLGYITCKYCGPEFSSVFEVLKLLGNLIGKKRLYRGIYDIANQDQGGTEENAEASTSSAPGRKVVSVHQSNSATSTEDASRSVLVKRLESCPNPTRGKTDKRSARYCSTDCVLIKRNKSKKMKISPEAIEECECYGWAPLQKAITLGHPQCVDNIVQEGPPDERDYGRLHEYKSFIPMISALIKEQGSVCDLLMDHSGNGLFDDINMNSDTPFDIFDDRDIGRIIDVGGETSSSPETWKQFHFNPNDIPLVAQICVILVESYFVTHKYTDVLTRLRAIPGVTIKKENEESNEGNYDAPGTSASAETSGEEPKEWEIGLYERDINENMNKLLEMMTEYANRKKIETDLEPLNKFLNDGTRN